MSVNIEGVVSVRYFVDEMLLFRSVSLLNVELWYSV